jgi:hypothetical protein
MANTKGSTTLLLTALQEAVEAAGFSISGPTDWRAAEHGEPRWVCAAREAIAQWHSQTNVALELARAVMAGPLDGWSSTMDPDDEAWAAYEARLAAYLAHRLAQLTSRTAPNA